MKAAPRGKLIAAFAAIYLIWGSTFLAIRFAIETLPPFSMVATRYLIAGSVLYLWARVSGAARPEHFHWKGAALIGGLLLAGGNGGVVWSEQLIASSLAALFVSTEPLWIVLFDWMRPGGVRPSAQVVFGLVLGFAGVAFLLDPKELGAGGKVALPGVLAILGASISWALGTVCSRYPRLPASAPLATAMEMLSGGALLFAMALLTGEGSRVHVHSVSLRSALALGYLIVFGSFIGFTAYVWLLRVTTPARVATHAFVNPVVAVLLGWLMAGEPITLRMLVAAAMVVAAVVVITAYKARRPESRPQPVAEAAMALEP